MGARTKARPKASKASSARSKAASALALAALATMVGGVLVLAVGPAAWADSSGSSTGSSGSSTSGPTTAPGSNLGGFTLSSSAAGFSVDYNQPNFPIPANPTLEFDVGYSAATYNAGPVGSANASAIWPGPVIAGGGSQLPLLIDPYLQQYAGPLASTLEPLVPTAGAWPIQAASAYPQGPPTASNNNGPLAMDSEANTNDSKATSALGLIGGANTSVPSGMVTVQAVGSTSEDTIDSLGNAVSEATSSVHGIDIAGGLIHIGAVTSTGTSSSDGNNATLSGGSNVTGVTVAGQQVSVNSGGISVSNQNENLLSAAPNPNQLLNTAGITMALTNSTDTVSGPSGQRQLDGLKVTIDLSTYDQDFSKLVAMLPAQLTSGLNQLPLPTPYKQSITIDFGWAQVAAAASPAFNPSLTLNTPNDNGSSTLGTTGTGGTPGTLGTPGTPGTSGTTGGSPSPTVRLPNASPAALFKGVGTGLIILGLILAAVLTAFLLWSDRAVGRLAAAVPCVGEDIANLG